MTRLKKAGWDTEGCYVRGIEEGKKHVEMNMEETEAEIMDVSKMNL